MGAYEDAAASAASTLIRVELEKVGPWQCLAHLVGRGDVQNHGRWRLEVTTKGKGTPSVNIGQLEGSKIVFRMTVSRKKKTLRACLKEAAEKLSPSTLDLDTLKVSISKGDTTGRAIQPVVSKEFERAWR